MKTILRIGNFPTNLYPGVGLHIYNLQNICGYKTLFISIKLDGRPLKLNSPNELIRLKTFLVRRGTQENKYIHRFYRIIKALIFNFQCIVQLIKTKPNIVHIHSPYYLPTLWIANILGKRCFQSYHGSDFNAVKPSKTYPYFVKGIEKVLYLGSQMKPGLEKIHNRNKILEVYNGVDTNQFKDIGLVREKVIIAIGSLKKEKGFYYLLKAFSILINKNQLSQYKLVIVGEGELEKELKDISHDLGINHFVSFVGHLNRASIIERLQQSELFVLSSISEGFPKVLLEAISSGCKIVSTDVGSVRTILGSGFEGLVPIKDEILLSEAINKIINQERNKKLAHISENFTWDKVRLSYQKLYDKC